MGERIHQEAGAGAGAIDFAAILDSIDVLIDGSNVSARAPQDAVFLLIRDLLVGCEGLASGRTSRAAVAFYESAWELVVRREGEAALVSFYRGGASPRIEVKDRPVAFQDLVHAVAGVASSMVARLQSLDPGIVADPFVGELMGALERLGALDDRGALEAVRTQTHRLQMAHEPDLAGAEGMGFAFSMTATEGDLLSPTTPNRSDLYSLMAWGRLSCLFEGNEVMSTQGRVFFMIESLLLTCRHVLGCIEEHRDLELTQEGDSLRVETHLDSVTESLTVTLVPLVAGVPSAEATPATISGVSALSFVDAVMGTARSLRRQILDINPGQRSNLKFELLSGEVDTLGTWRKDLTDSTIVNTESHAHRYEMPRQTLPRRDDGGGMLAGVRRLMYSKRWEAEAEGLRLDATFLCGDRLVLASRQLMAALDRESGEPLWRRAGLPGRTLALMTGETGLVTVSPAGEVGLVDLSQGHTQWTTRIPPSSGSPAGVVAGGGRRPRWVVLTSGESGLVAVDLFTGEVRWRFRTRRGKPSGFARMGRLLAFTCRSSSVYCLDVDTGDLVWRLSERSRFDLPPAALGEIVAVWLGGAAGAGRILAVDSLTGEILWSALALGRPLALPVRTGSHVVAATTHAGMMRLVSLDVDCGEQGWSREIDGITGPVALLALDGAVVVHSAQGVVMCIDAATGRSLWSRELVETPTVELPLSLEPVLRDGGLFVPLDTTYVLNPVDGSLLHRLDTDSPVPDLLRVDEQYSIYTAELSGHVSAYGVVGHLNVVRP